MSTATSATAMARPTSPDTPKSSGNNKIKKHSLKPKIFLQLELSSPQVGGKSVCPSTVSVLDSVGGTAPEGNNFTTHVRLEHCSSDLPKVPDIKSEDADERQGQGKLADVPTTNSSTGSPRYKSRKERFQKLAEAAAAADEAVGASKVRLSSPTSVMWTKQIVPLPGSGRHDQHLMEDTTPPMLNNAEDDRAGSSMSRLSCTSLGGESSVFDASTSNLDVFALIDEGEIAPQTPRQSNRRLSSLLQSCESSDGSDEECDQTVATVPVASPERTRKSARRPSLPRSYETNGKAEEDRTVAAVAAKKPPKTRSKKKTSSQHRSQSCSVIEMDGSTKITSTVDLSDASDDGPTTATQIPSKAKANPKRRKATSFRSSQLPGVSSSEVEGSVPWRDVKKPSLLRGGRRTSDGEVILKKESKASIEMRQENSSEEFSIRSAGSAVLQPNDGSPPLKGMKKPASARGRRRSDGGCVVPKELKGSTERRQPRRSSSSATEEGKGLNQCHRPLKFDGGRRRRSSIEGGVAREERRQSRSKSRERHEDGLVHSRPSAVERKVVDGNHSRPPKSTSDGRRRRSADGESFLRRREGNRSSDKGKEIISEEFTVPTSPSSPRGKRSSEVSGHSRRSSRSVWSVSSPSSASSEKRIIDEKTLKKEAMPDLGLEDRRRSMSSSPQKQRIRKSIK